MICTFLLALVAPPLSWRELSCGFSGRRPSQMTFHSGHTCIPSPPRAAARGSSLRPSGETSCHRYCTRICLGQCACSHECPAGSWSWKTLDKTNKEELWHQSVLSCALQKKSPRIMKQNMWTHVSDVVLLQYMYLAYRLDFWQASHTNCIQLPSCGRSNNACGERPGLKMVPHTFRPDNSPPLLRDWGAPGYKSALKSTVPIFWHLSNDGYW